MRVELAHVTRSRACRRFGRMRRRLRRMGPAALFWVAGTGALDVFEERLEAELDGVDVPVSR
jgi:hypothetical protein